MSRRLKAVILDFDGVVIDSRPAWMHFFGRVKESVGAGALTPEEQEFVFMYTVPDSIRRIVPQEREAEAFAFAAAFPMDEVLPLITVMPGLLDILARLAERRVYLGLNTNGGAEVHGILKDKGLAGRFDLVVTAADVRRAKPDPEGALRILNAAWAAPGEAIFVGDSDVDERTAEAAGVPFAAFRNPELAAHVHLEAWTGFEAAVGRFYDLS